PDDTALGGPRARRALRENLTQFAACIARLRSGRPTSVWFTALVSDTPLQELRWGRPGSNWYGPDSPPDPKSGASTVPPRPHPSSRRGFANGPALTVRRIYGRRRLVQPVENSGAHSKKAMSCRDISGKVPEKLFATRTKKTATSENFTHPSTRTNRKPPHLWKTGAQGPIREQESTLAAPVCETENTQRAARFDAALRSEASENRASEASLRAFRLLRYPLFLSRSYRQSPADPRLLDPPFRQSLLLTRGL